MTRDGAVSGQIISAAAIANRPWAASQRWLDTVMRCAHAMARVSVVSLPVLRDEAYDVDEQGVASIQVVGPLVGRADPISSVMGWSTYDDVVTSVTDALADPAVRAVQLDMDTPGGEIDGLFDAADAIAAARAAAGKPMWAVARGAALSAGYLLASAAGRVYVTRTGQVGSIGVVAAHVDQSAADEKAGLRWTLVHAGARKVDGNPHEPLSPRAAGDMQADVDRLYDGLVSAVASYRRMPADVIRGTDAAIYRGAEAVRAGLADREVRFPVTFLAAAAGAPAASAARLVRDRRGAQHMTDDDMSGPAPDPEPTAAHGEAGAAGHTPPAAEREGDIAAVVRAEVAELLEVAAVAGRLGVTVDVAEAVRAGTSADALRRVVLERAAAAAAAADIVAAAPGAAGQESPIVRMARERASGRR